MIERVMDLLKGSYWKLDLSRVRFTNLELDFLREFFEISFDRVVDDLTSEERAFLVLKKKVKYLTNPYIN